MHTHNPLSNSDEQKLHMANTMKRQTTNNQLVDELYKQWEPSISMWLSGTSTLVRSDKVAALVEKEATEERE